MNIDELIEIVKKKLQESIKILSIKVEDKSFLHTNHSSNEKGKFHLKISIDSDELKKIGRIESTKKVYKILDKELKDHIHSIQILIL